MAVTHSSLLIMGSLALLASAVLVVNADRATRFAVSFLGSIIWALFAMSSFDVASQAFTEPQPVYPLVYIGAALSVGVGMLSLYQLALLLSEETDATPANGLIE